MKTLEEQLKIAKQAKKKADERIALVNSKTRKLKTRGKIIFGAIAMKVIQSNPKEDTKKVVRDWMNEAGAKPRERAVVEAWMSIQDAEAAKPSKK